MDDKQLKFTVKVDPQGLQEIERKIRQINASTQMMQTATQTAQKLEGSGMGGIVSKPSREAFDRALQDQKKAMMGYIQELAKKNEDIRKQYDVQLSKLKELNAERDKLVKNSDEYLKKEQQIAAVQHNADVDHAKYMQQAGIIGKISDNVGGGGGKTPGAGGATGFGADMGGALAAVGKVLGTVSAIVATGTALYDNYTSLPLQRNMATGNAINSVVGQDLQGIGNGDVVNTMAWQPERMKARGMAGRKMESQKSTDLISAMTGVGGIASGVGGAMGIGNGRVWDLMMGTLLDGFAKNLESGALAPVSQITGLGKGMEKVAGEYLTTYNSKIVEEYGKNYQQMAEAEVKKNPLKNLASDYLSKNYMVDLQAQRMMGMDYGSYHGAGGYRESANMAGFNPEIALQTSQQIQGAGGSTRGMRSPIMAMQAARGFDMTNAGSVFGRISGSAGGSQASEQIFKRLLEESVKAGLDKSEFREEQRKFADITSQILNTAGITTADDAAKMMGGFTRFMGGEPTMKDLSATQSAYQEFQSGSAETSGRGGALQFAGMMKDPVLRKIGAGGLAGLMEIPENQLTADNPRIIAKASQAGVSPDELIERLTGVKREKSLVEVGLSPQQTAKFGDYMKENNLDVGKLSSGDLDMMKQNNPEAYNQYQKMVDAGAVKSPYESGQKVSAVLRGYMTSGNGPGGGATGAAGLVDQRLAGTSTGRVEDEVVKSTGVASQAMLENFRNFKKEITPASDALDSFTKRLILLTQAINAAPDKYKAEVGAYVGQRLSQPQGSKPKSK